MSGRTRIETKERLLALDDEPLICDAITQVATGCGFDVVTTVFSEAFAPFYKAHDPDIIILDLNLPGHDGIEHLRFLGDENCEAAIVLISGADSRVLNAAQRLGINHGLRVVGTLRKPFAADELRMVIATARDGYASANGKEARSRSGAAATNGHGESENNLGHDRPPSEHELRRAIANDELTLHYQPKVDLRNRHVIGVEALTRWHHPRRGLVMPNTFIPLAQEAGLISALTWQVLEKALDQCVLWNAQGAYLSVAVNVATQTLSDLCFPDAVADLLESHGVEAEQLIFEVMETEIMSDPISILDVLTRLRLQGIGISVDDFGTGHASLVELSRMPFNELKIDKSFVMESTGDSTAGTVVGSTIELAHELGLGVVAEGVKNADIWHFLLSLGCDIAQGYHIARPLGAEDLTAWMWNPNRACTLPRNFQAGA